MKTATRPNILFITTDQHRADCLSVAGHPVIQTPHLDQLAYEGVRFTAAYSDCPICIPARCSIISGRHAFAFGKPYYFSHESFPIDREQTLMSLLTKEGYQTQAVGKMHFYPERSCYGFEHMVLDHDYTEWLNEKTDNAHLSFVGNGVGLNEFWPSSSPVPLPLTSASWTAEQSINFLRKRDPDRPFFMWTSFFDPHPPVQPPEPYYSMYDDYPIPEAAGGDWDDDAPYSQRYHREKLKYDLIPPRTVRKIRSAYYGLVTHIDHQLGRLFGAMRQLGLMDNTLIVYTTDHGEMLGDHRDFGKETLYDGSSRIPFIIRWPKGYADDRRGVTEERPVGLVDVLPTLLAFAGGKAPEGLDGKSLLAMARGDETDWRDCYPCEVKTAQGRMFSLTDGKEKYIWYEWGGREQFFNLAADPLECRDASREPAYADRVAYWRAKLKDHLSSRAQTVLRNGELPIRDTPYPSNRDVRAVNGLGWNYDRPNM